MKIRKAGIGVTVALGVVAAAAAAGMAVAGPGGSGDPGDVLKSGVTKAHAQSKLPGVIGMVRDGADTRYAKAGWGDRFERKPADPHAKFRIGSNTKSWTATVVLQLEAEGKLSLDDTVDHWLPGVVARNGNDGKHITLRQLLNQTSGLPDYLKDPRMQAFYVGDVNRNQRWEPRKLVDVATAGKPHFKPGQRWEYSNTNYILAGMVIKAATGHEPAEEVTKRIIRPLGLKHTTYPAADSELHGDWLHGYTSLRDISFSNVQITGAAGAIVSTAHDLADFDRALFSGKLLPAKQQHELETTVPTDEDHPKGAGYGLGVLRDSTECGEVWTHDGGALGYRSFWASSPDGSRQAVVAGNEYHGTDDDKVDGPLGKALVNAYCATAPRS